MFFFFFFRIFSGFEGCLAVSVCDLPGQIKPHV